MFVSRFVSNKVGYSPFLTCLFLPLLLVLPALSQAQAQSENDNAPELVVTGPIKEKDVIWDKDTSKYKTEILVVLNNLVRDNKHCAKDIELGVVMRSGTRGNRKDPVFFVPCGTGYSIHNIWFRPKDAYKKAMVAPKPISASNALLVCQHEVKKKLTIPQTFKMGFWGTSYHPFASGRVKQTFGFKAKNSFGLELKYNASCLFENNHKVLDVIITEG